MNLSLKSSMTASKLAERRGGGLFYNGDGIYYNGGLLVYNGVDNAEGLVDPEAGLTLTTEFAPESSINGSVVDETLPCVLAMDFVGLDGSSGGFIFERGSSNSSGFVGFEADGTLIIRVGDGRARWNSGTAYYEIPNASSLVTGNGTLVLEFGVSVPSVRAYWNRVSLGTAVPAISGTSWGGSGDGQYLGTLSSGLPIGEDGTLQLTYATASDLRYYENQLLSI
jgi:hypothetical protein